jgi:hypothetical protein
LTEEWASVEFEAVIEDATGKWDYSTEVEANVANVSFEGEDERLRKVTPLLISLNTTNR